MVTLTDNSEIAAAAQSYLAAGLCVLPANLRAKRPALVSWKAYQSRLPSQDEVSQWFCDGYYRAICLVAGCVSGNVEMIDFDCQAEAYRGWRERVESESPGLTDKLVVEQSQSGGMHVVYRLDGIVPGSMKLAEKVCVAADPDSAVYLGKTYSARQVGECYEYYPALIETRGEGGLFLCAPSPGYNLLQGQFEELPVLTAEEREVLIRCARSFNERIEMAPAPAIASAGGDRPGDEFNRRGDIREVLTRHGWTLAREGDNQHWRRPGKDHNWSATYNGEVFYCFSSSAEPFEVNRGYSKFQVYALLEHNGDYSAAASALRAQGYGGSQSDAPSAQTPEPPVPDFKSIGQLLHDYPQLRAPVVNGLLRQGETMNVIAPPKTGKSWLVTDLALSVATGRPWLGSFPTVRSQVLILDNELHSETIAHRIPKVADARGIDLREVAEEVFVENLRGRLRDLLALGPYFNALEPGRFRLVILDAWYRFVPADTDENDNGSVARLYNHLDHYAHKIGCSFVLIHHASKGNQSSKSITDVGAGAGSQSRATDTHLVLRAHEEDKVVVLDAAVRSWPPIEPVCLHWDFPVFNPVTGLDPAALRPERPRRKPKEPNPKLSAPKPPQWDVEMFVSTCVSDEGQVRDRLLDIAMNNGVSKARARALLQMAEAERKVHRWVSGASKPVRFATVPQPLIETPRPKGKRRRT